MHSPLESDVHTALLNPESDDTAYAGKMTGAWKFPCAHVLELEVVTQACMAPHRIGPMHPLHAPKKDRMDRWFAPDFSPGYIETHPAVVTTRLVYS